MNECANDSIYGMYLYYYLYGGVQMRCLLSGAVTVPPDQPYGRANLYTQRQWQCCQPVRKACPVSPTNQE